MKQTCLLDYKPKDYYGFDFIRIYPWLNNGFSVLLGMRQFSDYERQKPGTVKFQALA
jgi:hypothetical protein